MAGVSVGPDQDTQDLKSIMEGGNNFVARMTALQTRKRDLDAVIANLGIATDYKNRVEEVKANQEEAKKTLTEARQEAARVRKAAQDDAAVRLKAAGEEVDKILAEARDTASKIAREASEHLDEAKSKSSNAKKLHAEAESLRNGFADRQSELDKSAEAAAKAERDAEKLAYEFQWRINALKEVVEQIQAAEVPPPDEQPTSEPPPPPEPEPEPEDPEPPPTRRKGRR